jgi:Fic family protein
MSIYIYQLLDWPRFSWDQAAVSRLSAEISHRQGRLLGRMERLEPGLQAEATQQILTLEATNPGEMEMMLEVSRQYPHPLTDERLSRLYTALFPTGNLGKIPRPWRDNPVISPARVISASAGRERLRFQAPASDLLSREMQAFLRWFNSVDTTDPLIKAAIAHLWFATLHPFDDGNGRIARAISRIQLARADNSPQRFYSMTIQIKKESEAYYDILEKTQKGTLDITDWLDWFLRCLDRAIAASDELLAGVLKKASIWEKSAVLSFNERQKLVLNHLMNGVDGKITSSGWARITQSSPDTALRDITDLLKKGILEKERGGGRSTCYVLQP